MVLKPTKHSHPDRTVISVSLLLLSRLKKRRIESFDSLRKYVNSVVKDGDVLFLPSLNFLFLVGLVRYHQKTDSFEYLKQNENI